MPKRLWEYTSQASLKNEVLYLYASHGTGQAMVFNAEQGLLFHCIDTDVDENWVVEMIAAKQTESHRQMLLNEPFQLMPAAFADASLLNALPGKVQTVALDDQYVLGVGNSNETDTFHAVAGFYKTATINAEKHPLYLAAYLHQSQLTLLFFKNGRCQLGNSYPVTNESEMLYFVVAAIKKSGHAVTDVLLELALNAEDKERVFKTFSRFLPQLNQIQLELPYESGEYPPYALESWLMFLNMR